MEFTRFGGKLIGLVCTVALLLGCAEIAPPPGGQVDKTRPQITETKPENGAVSVPIDNQLTIYFSEKITKPQTSAIFISPRLQEEPKFHWSSDKVRIEFPDSFKTNQTYIISLSESIKDYRNNPIDTGSIIAFSTGPEIAKGMITGKVVDINNQPAPSILVGLYDADVFETSEAIDSIYPSYIAQTDRDGSYSFRYLPYGSYTLIGFQDKNNNERFNPAREFYAIPDERAILESENFEQDIDLVLSRVDTNSIQIRSAFLDTDKLVRVNLSKPLDLEQVKQNLDSITIISLVDSSTYQPEFFTESGMEKSETFSFYFGDIKKENYSLRMLYELSENPLTFDTMKFTEAADKTIPKINAFTPDFQPVLSSELEVSIQFSEPIDTAQLTEETFAVIAKDSSIVIPQMLVANQSRLVFNSPVFSNPGSYEFLISAFDISDLAGNSMGDTLIKYMVNVLDPDSMGTITGTVESGDSLSQSLMLVFKNIRNQKIKELLYDGTSFAVSLMAGDYQISGFFDRNNNGKRDAGKLFPLEYPEKFYIHSDTISVRARFETSDINFILE